MNWLHKNKRRYIYNVHISVLIIWTISFVSRVSVIHRSIHIWFIGYDCLFTSVLKQSYGRLICSFQWLNNQPVLTITFGYNTWRSTFSTVYTPCVRYYTHLNYVLTAMYMIYLFWFLSMKFPTIVWTWHQKMWAKWQISSKTLFILWYCNTWIFPKVI